MFPKLSPGFVKNDTWISLWRENNIYIVQNWRLEAYIGKRSTLCLQNTFDAPCQRRLKASCCIKRIKSLNYYGTGLHKLWHPCILAARKWRENEEMKRNRRENEEMERKWREVEEMERFTLHIFSFFLPTYAFPMSKIVKFCRKMLSTALLSQMSQKTEQHTRYEKIILGQIRCEKAPQYVPGC